MKSGDVLTRPRRTGLRVSPTGRSALFREATPVDGVLVSRLVLRDLGTGTNRDLDAHVAAFAPDGRILAFDGAAFRFLDAPHEVVLEWPAPVARIEAHERGFVFETPPPPGPPVAAYSTEFVRHTDRRVESGPQLWSFLDGSMTPLLRESERWRIHSTSWSAGVDGSVVAILRDRLRPTRLSRPAVLSPDRELEPLGEAGFWYEQVRWSSDGRECLAIRRVLSETGTFAAPTPVRLSVGSDDELLDSDGRWTEGLVPGPDGSYVLMAHSNGYDQALRVDASGVLELFPGASATDVQYAAGRWWALTSDFFTEPDIAASTVHPEAVTTPVPCDGLITVERRTVGIGAGALRMWMLTPTQRAGAIPVIVFLSAYTPSAWANRWFFRWNPAVWAAEGYAVLMVDVHPTTSGGAATAEMCWGDWDRAAKRDIDLLWTLIDGDERLDASRVFTLGGGWGGWLAGYLATNDARFAGHAIHSGAWDLVSYLSTNDQGDRWEDQLGDPRRYRAALDRMSPWAGTVVPERVIIFAGDRDFRSPVEQSIHALHDLVRAGSDAILVDIAGESHVFGSLHTEEAWYGMLQQWFRGEPVSAISTRSSD